MAYLERFEQIRHSLEIGSIHPEDIISFVFNDESRSDLRFEKLGISIDKKTARSLLLYAAKALAKKDSPQRTDLLWKTLTTDFGRYQFSHSEFSKEECTHYRNLLETDVGLAISSMINDTHWEINPQGCTSCYIHMEGLSINGFEIAIEIALDIGMFDIAEKMAHTLSTLPWFRGNKLGAIGAKALVQIIGMDAIDVLAEYATWQSPKWECGIYPDPEVTGALSLLGPETIPRLRKHLFRQGYLDEGIMNVIAGFGQDGIEEIAGIARQSFEPNGARTMIETLAMNNYDITEIVLICLSELAEGEWEFSDEDIRMWIDALPVHIDLSQAYQFLQNEDEALRIGTCVLLQHRPNQDSIKLLVEELKREEDLLHQIKAATKINSIELIEPLLEASGKMADPGEYRASVAWTHLAEYVYRLGKDGIRILTEWLKHGDWIERLGPLVSIGLISKMENGIALLGAPPLKPLLTHFLADVSGYQDNLQYPATYWGWRAIALSRDLHFQIHDSEWKIEKIARAIKDSIDPLNVLAYISYDSELMKNPIIRAAEESVSRLDSSIRSSKE